MGRWAHCFGQLLYSVSIRILFFAVLVDYLKVSELGTKAGAKKMALVIKASSGLCASSANTSFKM